MIECDSTQDELKRHVEAYQLVSTEKQSLGRGRGAHTWEHEPGALAFSFAAKPHPQLTWQSLEVAVSIAESFEQMFATPIGLKWPNDLFQAEKKCGGILLQHQAPHMFIGVGINLLPNPHWGSVFAQSRVLPAHWAHDIPRQLVENYLHRFPRPIQELRDAWLSRCVHHGKTVTITEGSMVHSGSFEGLGPHGEALVGGQAIYNGTLRWN